LLLIAQDWSWSTDCCQKTQDFFQQGCDQYAAAYATLSPVCQQFRRLCPSSACNAGQVVSEADLSCISANPGSGTAWCLPQGYPVLNRFAAMAESLTIWRAVAAAAASVIVVLLVVFFLCWRRQVRRLNFSVLQLSSFTRFAGCAHF
jgi:hypothetical protein